MFQVWPVVRPHRELELWQRYANCWQTPRAASAAGSRSSSPSPRQACRRPAPDLTLLKSLRHDANGAARGAAGERRIGFQCRRDRALARRRLPRRLALCDHRRATALEFSFRHSEVDLAVGNIELDGVAFLDQTDQSAFGGFRRDMADRQAR